MVSLTYGYGDDPFLILSYLSYIWFSEVIVIINSIDIFFSSANVKGDRIAFYIIKPYSRSTTVVLNHIICVSSSGIYTSPNSRN